MDSACLTLADGTDLIPDRFLITTCIRCGDQFETRYYPGRLSGRLPIYCRTCRCWGFTGRATVSGQGRATAAVFKAIADGRLPHPTTLTCADCGVPAAVYDHRDYAKPLDVTAVCRPCNWRRGPALWANARPILPGQVRPL